MSRYRNRLTIILPFMSLLVTGVVMGQQYARRERLHRELRLLAREYLAIEARLPKSAVPATHAHDD